MTTFTWHIWLDDLCRRMKASEKKAFTTAVGVSKTTLNRWRRGADNPKTANLERMLLFLTEEQQQQFLFLLRKDLKVWASLPMSIQETHLLGPQEDQEERLSVFLLGMLNSFSIKMLRLQRDTPDRFWQLSGAILREMLKQLETHPTQTGLEVTIAKCMPPKDGKVRSLRTFVSMGTPPWRGDLHTRHCFLGAESLAGYAIFQRHGEMVPDLTDTGSHIPIPVQAGQHERSVAAFPITREQCVAGVLQIASTQVNYFTPERMALIEICADLIRLAFYDEEFYPLASIDLRLMPSLALQESHFMSFRQRVEFEYRRMSSDESTSLRELTKVEEKVRTQIEEELLNTSPEKSVIM